MRNAILLTVVLLSACGSAEDSNPVGAHRAEVLADLGLSESFDPEEAAALAREWVYVRNNPLPPDSVPIPDDKYEAYSALKSGEKKYWCAGMAYVLAWMLEEIGIPARQVAIASEGFFDGISPADTHQTVEAHLGGWVVHDPSFNVTFQCAGGEDTSIGALRLCADSVTWRYGGVVYPGRTLEEYPLPVAGLLYGYHYYLSDLMPEVIPDYPHDGWYL